MAEAVVRFDITGWAMLREEPDDRGIVLAMARVKQPLFGPLSRAGVVKRIGPQRFFPTLPTATAVLQGLEGSAAERRA